MHGFNKPILKGLPPTCSLAARGSGTICFHVRLIASDSIVTKFYMEQNTRRRPINLNNELYIYNLKIVNSGDLCSHSYC